jgi:hypothetical protein
MAKRLTCLFCDTFYELDEDLEIERIPSFGICPNCQTKSKALDVKLKMIDYYDRTELETAISRLASNPLSNRITGLKLTELQKQRQIVQKEKKIIFDEILDLIYKKGSEVK